jgi:hypothetical protein
MSDLAVEIMQRAPVRTKWGNLPGIGAEINGDVLQVRVRLACSTTRSIRRR